MGRQKIIPFDVRLAERINAGQIVRKLVDHIHDPEKTPLLQTQLNAARILLNKCMPDVQSISIENNNLPTTDPNGITNEQLRTVIAGTCIRTAIAKTEKQTQSG
jgi:hypothetical protein